MQNGNQDFLVFTLGTIGMVTLTYLFQKVQITYPEFAASVVCTAVYAYLFK